MKNIFNDIRNWGEIRGLKGNDDPQVQMYRLLEEIAELHKAVTENDKDEVIDAIGDIMIVLTQLSKSYDIKVEECLEKAFSVIELRKGLNKNGSFVRYQKLSDEDKEVCDKKQGNPGNEYFTDMNKYLLKPKDFKN
jgi:NTP pyrophosphatase (non-canonical NTP hydrolase)